MLRVAEQYVGTDTGRQRRANEDSMLARSPLFVVADGMGGARAGEVASRLAIEAFQHGLGDTADAEGSLAAHARAANVSIHERSQADAEHAGMGTTLTAMYVGAEEVAIAHVGDSRAYCLREGELLRLTDDHSLVDELIRQGKLTPEEAIEHPQRSVITRALGPEAEVEIDTRSFRARDGDVYLLCSDGLTTMVPDALLGELLLAHGRLRDAGEALIAAANEAGGRDNITVVLLRLEEVAIATASPADDPATLTGIPALPANGAVAPISAATDTQRRPVAGGASPAMLEPPVVRAAEGERSGPRRPRHPAPNAPPRTRRRRRLRRLVAGGIVLGVLALIAAGVYVTAQSIYFIGTNSRGLVTLYSGFPYELPGGLKLYRRDYVSGVSASMLSAQRRRTLLDHSLRSEADAAELVRSLELGELK
ncbi:MAG TPA: Stp1/IreP family PP2C-type Ser/Thr phosphatase [Solirubrobacteraceae bacterium]|jgi:protein phosphatase